MNLPANYNFDFIVFSPIDNSLLPEGHETNTPHQAVIAKHHVCLNSLKAIPFRRRQSQKPKADSGNSTRITFAPSSGVHPSPCNTGRNSTADSVPGASLGTVRSRTTCRRGPSSSVDLVATTTGGATRCCSAEPGSRWRQGSPRSRRGGSRPRKQENPRRNQTRRRSQRQGDPP